MGHKHTPLPWILSEGAAVSGLTTGLRRIEGADVVHTCGGDGCGRSASNVVAYLNGDPNQSEYVAGNVDLILSCVNACAGIANPAAIADAIQFVKDVASEDALDSFYADDIETTDLLELTNAWINEATAALAKLKVKP